MSKLNSERVIPLASYRPGPVALDALRRVVPDGLLQDTRARRLHDLRISVTDRCNFRCVYCMPRAVFDRDYPFVSHSELLSFEEITRLARVFVLHGVEKLRLTGGEPLVRKGIEDLVGMLAELKLPDGRPCDLTLTTNGSMLARKAAALKQAGLKRVTVSLDALDDAVFRRMNDADFPVEGVLEGIRAAHSAGLGPIKVNMVVRRGMNDDEILPMARYFRHTGHIVRFIEYMDVGNSNGWCMRDVVTSAELIERIHAVFPLVPVGPNYPGEVAQRWRYQDGAGEIGVISSVSQAFCSSCTRARLSTEGFLYTCLFATQGFDLRSLLRGAASDADLANAIGQVWQSRSDRYSEIRTGETADRRKVEMSYIGG